MVQSTFSAAFGAPRTSVPLQVNLAEAVTAVGDLSVTVTARPGAALDDRVRVLEDNLTRLREEWHSGKNALRREVGALKEAVQTERAAQASGDNRTASKIEDLAVGGLHLEYVGVTWLLFGTILSGFSWRDCWLECGPEGARFAVTMLPSRAKRG